ncbi:hypothetical protein [Nonomuraea aridisoli]|uniref:Uncharacterized protein n=1 Tax=Nonomuraea aridisoli TaxID=2070368 RepID=A0A2W2DIA1_9ACTN|nr:hypothetical protein [Nonomuraea aridisoli]PZG03659.1 hypothetical protein C1J01_45655 [Nonomuraea aridisoli]
MVRRDKAYRRLVVGERVYRWRVGHAHVRDGSGCREVVAFRAEGVPVRLTVVFAEGPGPLSGRASAGAGCILHTGGVLRSADGAYLNLNRPAVARALLDEALSDDRGCPAGDLELDGWPLMGAVLSRVPGPA